MWVSMVIFGFLTLILGVLYVKTVRAIEQDDINEAIARAERLKNKRLSNGFAGA